MMADDQAETLHFFEQKASRLDSTESERRFREVLSMVPDRPAQPGDELPIALDGQPTEAPCDTCQSFTQARFGYGSFELEDGLVVENVMRATCESCGTVVSLAPQSSHLLRQALGDVVE